MVISFLSSWKSTGCGYSELKLGILPFFENKAEVAEDILLRSLSIELNTGNRCCFIYLNIVVSPPFDLLLIGKVLFETSST